MEPRGGREGQGSHVQTCRSETSHTCCNLNPWPQEADTAQARWPRRGLCPHSRVKLLDIGHRESSRTAGRKRSHTKAQRTNRSVLVGLNGASSKDGKTWGGSCEPRGLSPGRRLLRGQRFSDRHCRPSGVTFLPPSLSLHPSSSINHLPIDYFSYYCFFSATKPTPA